MEKQYEENKAYEVDHDLHLTGPQAKLLVNILVKEVNRTCNAFSERPEVKLLATVLQALVRSHDEVLLKTATVKTPGQHNPDGTWYPEGHSKFKK